MGENVTFELYNSSDESQKIWNSAQTTEYDTYNYSVNSYIETAKDRSDTLGAAALAMQNYGAWARKYLINENKISETTEIAEPTVIDDVDSANLAAYSVQKSEGFSVSGLSMSLLVESETTLRLYYSGDPIEVTATKNGKSVDVVSGTKGSRNYVEIRNISARDIDTAFVFNFGDSGTIEASALSYAYTVLKAYEENEQKADICNTVRALYKYNQAVKAYFE